MCVCAPVLSCVCLLSCQGGWLHVHANIGEAEGPQWTSAMVGSLQELAGSLGRRWTVTCDHLEWVKSYAPRIWHVVADVRCVPVVLGAA